MVVGGFRWFKGVLGGFRSFHVLVLTLSLMYTSTFYEITFTSE